MTIPTFEVLDAFKAILMVQVYVKNNMLFLYEIYISHMYMIKFFKENQIIAGLGALKPILEELLFQVHMLAFWAIKMTQKLNSDIYLKELNLNVCHMNNIQIPTTSLLWSKN